jgi:hypothetical protein
VTELEGRLWRLALGRWRCGCKESVGDGRGTGDLIDGEELLGGTGVELLGSPRHRWKSGASPPHADGIIHAKERDTHVSSSLPVSPLVRANPRHRIRHEGWCGVDVDFRLQNSSYDHVQRGI